MNIFKSLKAFAFAALMLAAFYSAGLAQVVATGALNTARRGHTATQLQDGKVLVVGGENAGGLAPQSELLDNGAATSIAGPARTDHTATLLPDGRVLIAGGRDSASLLDSTQIFNPADNSFSAGPSLKNARAGHTATALANGNILLVG